MKEYQTYKPGDVCRVREWDDMEAEFGKNASGYIQCKRFFTEQMRPLCGMTFTVAKVCSGRYYSVEGVESIGAEFRKDKNWVISADMLEPFTEEASLSPVSIPGW